MLTLKKVSHYIFFLGLFFFPFNSFEGIQVFGEFKNESGAYFFLLGFLLLFLSRKIHLPLHNAIFKIILIFLAWCFLSTLLNINGVTNSYFKQTTGINRFIRQYFALIISSLMFFVFYYNVLISMDIKTILLKIRKVFLFSLIIAFGVGMCEAMVGIFGISIARIPIYIFNYFPFFEKSYFTDRISSISFEPPSLAIYLITIAGWMFSYIITNKTVLRYIPTCCVLLLTFFSGSRTGLIVIFVQFILFFICVTPKEKISKYLMNSIAILSFLVVSVFIFKGDKIIKSVETKIESLDFKSNLVKNVSNKSRFGMQYAALQVFLDHPITGVGFGQQTYYSRFYYPGWATKDNYEFKYWYRNPNIKSFPPGYNIYTRLLAETGLIGISILLFLIYFSISKIWFLMKNSTDENYILSLISLISLIGLFINWLQNDSFRIYGVWLTLAILIRLLQDKHNVKNE